MPAKLYPLGLLALLLVVYLAGGLQDNNSDPVGWNETIAGIEQGATYIVTDETLEAVRDRASDTFDTSSIGVLD